MGYVAVEAKCVVTIMESFVRSATRALQAPTLRDIHPRAARSASQRPCAPFCEPPAGAGEEILTEGFARRLTGPPVAPFLVDAPPPPPRVPFDVDEGPKRGARDRLANLDRIDPYFQLSLTRVGRVRK